MGVLDWQLPQRTMIRAMSPSALSSRYSSWRAQEARIVEGDEARLAEAPVLEAADDHSAIDEVDHRARTERRDELTLTELAVRTVHFSGVLRLSRCSHQPLSSSCLNRSHTCA